jgi:hypothetical protein
MGRIRLSNPPPRENPVRDGPTVKYIFPVSSDDIKADWQSFVENGGFRSLLQAVVKENIAQEEVVINDAKTVPGGEGWVHLCDERALPPYIRCLRDCPDDRFGRTPAPEDIIGSVCVKENKLHPDTYEAMPTYRLVTPEGPMKLSSFLLGKLRERLAQEK